MTEFIVFVETSDYFTVEADNEEEAKTKAKEIAANCSSPNEWLATWVQEMSVVKGETDGNKVHRI